MVATQCVAASFTMHCPSVHGHGGAVQPHAWKTGAYTLSFLRFCTVFVLLLSALVLLCCSHVKLCIVRIVFVFGVAPSSTSGFSLATTFLPYNLYKPSLRPTDRILSGTQWQSLVCHQSHFHLETKSDRDCISIHQPHTSIRQRVIREMFLHTETGMAISTCLTGNI